MWKKGCLVTKIRLQWKSMIKKISADTPCGKMHWHCIWSHFCQGDFVAGFFILSWDLKPKKVLNKLCNKEDDNDKDEEEQQDNPEPAKEQALHLNSHIFMHLHNFNFNYLFVYYLDEDLVFVLHVVSPQADFLCHHFGRGTQNGDQVTRWPSGAHLQTLPQSPEMAQESPIHSGHTKTPLYLLLG